MLKAGRIVALDTTANLLSRATTHALRIRLEVPATLPAELEASVVSREGVKLTLKFDRFDEVGVLLDRLRSAGARIEDMEVGKPDLEDVFVDVMRAA
jgi:ABC-2 type transport system ATP-binding protein